MRRWAGWVLRHRALVVGVWAVLAVAGGITAPRTVDSLSYDFGLPGQPAYEANQQILADFGSGGQVDPLILTIRLPAGTTVEDAGEGFEAAVGQIAQSTPAARVATPQTTGAKALVSADKRTLVAVLYPKAVPGPDPYVASLPAVEATAAKATVAGVPVVVTGVSALESTSSGGDRGVLAEIIFGATGALIILALVFGSLLAIVPLVIAAVAILTTFLCLLGLTQVTDVIFVVQFLVGLIGLGVAIDYSLLIVMRWREERAKGADNDRAVRTAIETAGHSVVFSGVTVAVSLAALIVVPLPFLRSIGLGRAVDSAAERCHRHHTSARHPAHDRPEAVVATSPGHRSDQSALGIDRELGGAASGPRRRGRGRRPPRDGRAASGHSARVTGTERVRLEHASRSRCQ